MISPLLSLWSNWNHLCHKSFVEFMAYRKPGTPSSSSKQLSTSETREMAMLTGAEIVKSKTPIVESKTPIHSYNLYLNLGKIFKSMHLFLMLSRTNTHKACRKCLSMWILNVTFWSSQIPKYLYSETLLWNTLPIRCGNIQMIASRK